MTTEQLAWQLLTEPPAQEASGEAAQEPPAATIAKPAVAQHPAEPAPRPAWSDLAGQAALVQKASEIEAARQAEDLKRRGLLMTAPDKPLNFDEAFGEVTRGRWVNIDEAARQELERRQRRTPPGWMGDCGDEFSW